MYKSDKTCYNSISNLLSENKVETNLLINVLNVTYNAFYNAFMPKKINWNELFDYLKIPYNSFCTNKTNTKTVYGFEVDFTFSLDDLIKNKEVIQRFLNVESNKLEFELKNNYLYITVFEDLNINYTYEPQKHRFKGFELFIGYNIQNKPVMYDISLPSNAHIGIFASSRWGKSNLMYLILCQLIQKPRHDIEIDLINPKIVDFYEFENVKNVKRYAESVDDAITILEENLEDMNNRYKAFKSAGVKSLSQYRSLGNKMPFKLVVIDELATFQGNKDFHNILTELSNKSAGAGIILMLSSQLLNKDIMSNQTRQNLSSVFGGKCKDKTKSDMIQEGAELHLDIKKVGQFKLYNTNSYGELTQTLFMPNEIIKEICDRNVKKSLRDATPKD